MTRAPAGQEIVSENEFLVMTEAADRAGKEWQTWLGVEADGDPGTRTLTTAIAKLLAGLLALRPLRYGDCGDAVKAVQGLLYAAGYDPNGLDGKYGPGMKAAVEKFQAANGLEADGSAGKDTVADLLDQLI